MALTGTVAASLQLTQTSASGLGAATYALARTTSVALADGTGAGQVDILWSSSRTLTATSEDIDLNGALVDAYGATVNLLRVKGIYIRNLATVDGRYLLVGGAAANGWVSMFGGSTDRVKVGAGGFFLNLSPLATAFAVTAGTADKLKVDAGANTVSYEIAIIGCSA